MKTLTPAFAAHIREPVTTLAICWRIQKSTGELVLGTQHDRDITVGVSQHLIVDLTGIYRAQAAITGSDVKSGSDMSVDNMEVEGATDRTGDEVVIDLTVDDIEAGTLDNAPVTVFLVNWADPDSGQAILRRGQLGALSRDSHGRYRTEVRGLAQLLSQNVGNIYQETCNVVRFGDARCRYDVDSILIDAPITAVTSNKQFSIAEPGATPPAGYPPGGEVLFLSGENEGFTREVKTATAAGGSLTVTLYEELPADVDIGDDIRLTPGCDRRWSTCRAYNNLANFRGWGVYIPGTLAMMRGPAPGQCEVPLPTLPDTTGPTAPTISAVGSSSSAISISRTANATDADGILHYETQRSLAGAGVWTTIDTSNDNPLSVSGLTADTAYDFRQRGVDTLGNIGAYSAVASASTEASDAIGPTAPTISASAASSSSISISRTVDSTDDDGVLNYQTQRSLAGASAWTTFDTSNSNPLAASGLSQDTAYDFRQRGMDTLGNPGAYSAVATETTMEGSPSDWEDVTVGMSGLGAELATAGRKVRLDLTGSDYGLRLDSVNGASSSQLLTGAFDGSAAIELRPQTGTTSNSNQTYVGVANGADLWNGGTTDVAQVNIGFCIYYGARYIDLAATAKVTGVIGAQSLGGETSGSASRAAIFENTYAGERIFAVTATTVQSYHQPVSGYFPEDGADSNKLMLLGTSIDHGNDPPLVGQEWLYFEQEVDYRRDRGNPNGRNRLDVWSRDGYLGYLEIPLTHRPDWDFTYQYAAYFEYLGGLFNNPSTANANNFFRVSHVIFSNNRAKDDRIGPPPGFLP
jgi:uncharacterized phage protein (TIGR02218 family)